MSRTPVPFAPDTLETIRRAFRLASDRRHDLVSLEHLLHALSRIRRRARSWRAAASTSTTLRTDLEEVLDRAFTPVPGTQGRQARIDARLRSRRRARRGARRLVERAAGRERRLLVFLLQEEESHAAYFLRKQGVDRLTLLRAIAHGGRRPRRPDARPTAATPASPADRSARGLRRRSDRAAPPRAASIR